MQTFIEAARIAVQSILANKLRSFLTLLGVIIGVFVVIVVATIIAGANVYVAEKIADLGSGVFDISKASVMNIGDFEKFLEAFRKNPDLKTADVEALREGMRYAEHVGAQDGTGGPVKVGSLSIERVGIQGVTPSMAYLAQIDVAAGRYITEVDDESRRRVAFLGSEVADAVFPGVDPLGREVRVDGSPYTVIGVAKQKGSILGQSQDNFVVIPLSTFLKEYGGRRSLTIRVKAREGASMEAAQEEARTILRARHGLGYNDPDDFAIVTDKTTEDLFGQITGIVSAIAIPITSISLVVGGIVIMNIMLVVVTERTREIGIRKSLGATRRDILMQFLVESVILAGAGGVLGVLGGFLLVKLVSILVPWVPAAMPVFWSIMAVVISAGVGLFFGIYPAHKAAKLDPIQALRAD